MSRPSTCRSWAAIAPAARAAAVHHVRDEARLCAGRELAEALTALADIGDLAASDSTIAVLQQIAAACSDLRAAATVGHAARASVPHLADEGTGILRALGVIEPLLARLREGRPS